MNQPFHEILREFGVESEGNDRLVDLGSAGGFSGANIWRVGESDYCYCLRRWPTGANVDRVAEIHTAIERIATAGFELLAVPLRSTQTGRSYAQRRSEIYEVSPWLPGVADFCDSAGELRSRKLDSAMRSLARFHVAASSAGGCVSKCSPGMNARADRCRRLLQGGLQEVKTGLNRFVSQPSSQKQFAEINVACMKTLVGEFERLAPSVWQLLADAANIPTTLQLCLRDVWHDHILFTKDRVSGIVDYDAMQHESVCGDVARLLGSLVGNCSESWQNGIAAYRKVRALDPSEIELIAAFDWGNALLSGLQWVRWICVEQRQFSNVAAVQRRLDHWVSRVFDRKLQNHPIRRA